MSRPRRSTRSHHRHESPDAGRTPVGRALAIALFTLLLASLLDAEALEATAESQPFGWRHDVATAVVRPVVAVSRALHLTEPRRWIEDALDRPHPGGGDEPSTATTEPSMAPSTSPPSATSTTSSLPDSTAPPPTPSTVPPRRVPTAAAPLRLLIAGDSMTEAFGPALLDAATSTGVVTAEHELRYSSGITRPDYFDWPAELAALLAEHDPEAVVVMFGANDAQGIRTQGGTASFGSDAWIAEYRSRVAQVMNLLDGDGRTVYWIGQPVMRSGTFDERMSLVTGIYRDEATRHPGVRFVDTRELFASGGAYSAYLPGSDGQEVLMRRDDGIHLTAAGGRHLAGAVLDTIGQDWDLGSP